MVIFWFAFASFDERVFLAKTIKITCTLPKIVFTFPCKNMNTCSLKKQLCTMPYVINLFHFQSKKGEKKKRKNGRKQFKNETSTESTKPSLYILVDVCCFRKSVLAFLFVSPFVVCAPLSIISFF